MKTSNELSEEPLTPDRVGCDGSGSAWREIAAEMPELDQMIWLYDAKRKLGPYIGGRADSGEGWLWCRNYDQPWWNHKAARWEPDMVDTDDQPTHWMPLPFPPNT